MGWCWTRVAAGEVGGSGWFQTHFESRATGFAAALDMGYMIKGRVKEFLILSLCESVCVCVCVCVCAGAHTLCSVVSNSLQPHGL